MRPLVAVLLSALLLATGCSGGSTVPQAPRTSAAPSPSASDGDDGTVDDPAPTPSDDSADAGSDEDAPITFKETFQYEDGVKVNVTKIRTDRVSDTASVDGDKTKPGTPYVILTIKITNGTKKTIKVGDFAQTMTYGDDGDEAPAVFDDPTEAIDGKVLPGKSRTGTYGWVVAKKDRKNVQVEFEWDLDGDHETALFVGPLKS